MTITDWMKCSLTLYFLVGFIQEPLGFALLALDALDFVSEVVVGALQRGELVTRFLERPLGVVEGPVDVIAPHLRCEHTAA